MRVGDTSYVLDMVMMTTSDQAWTGPLESSATGSIAPGLELSRQRHRFGVQGGDSRFQRAGVLGGRGDLGPGRKCLAGGSSGARFSI
jgi:hypothetical protein